MSYNPIVKTTNCCAFSVTIHSPYLRFTSDAGVYHLTHPVDLSKFLKYIDDSEPFDLVIDGMNLFFVPVKMRRMAEHKKAGVSANKDNPTKVESMQQKELQYRF